MQVLAGALPPRAVWLNRPVVEVIPTDRASFSMSENSGAKLARASSSLLLDASRLRLEPGGDVLPRENDPTTSVAVDVEVVNVLMLQS